MTQHNRRETDKLMSLDIDQMILAEDDPKQRAFLIVLNSINKIMISNTAATKEVAQTLEEYMVKFNEHIRSDEALLNRVRGAWRVLAWVIGVVQVIGLGIWNEARTEIKAINIALKNLENRVIVVEKVTEKK